MPEASKKKAAAKRTAATTSKVKSTKATANSKAVTKTATKPVAAVKSKQTDESVKMHYSTEPSVAKARFNKAGKKTLSTLRSRKFWLWAGTAVITVFLLLIVWWQWQRSYIAVVGGQYLPVSMMDAQLRANYGTNGVNSIIQQQLILQEGNRQKIKVTDKQVSDQLSEIKTSSGGNKAYEEQLQQLGIPESLLQYQVKVQLIREALLKDKIQVTDAEITEYYEQNKESIDAAGTTGVEGFKDQIKETLKQQKLDSATPEFVDSLKQRSKVETNLNHLSLTFGQFLQETIAPIPGNIWNFVSGKK